MSNKLKYNGPYGRAMNDYLLRMMTDNINMSYDYAISCLVHGRKGGGASFRCVGCGLWQSKHTEDERYKFACCWQCLGMIL